MPVTLLLFLIINFPISYIKKLEMTIKVFILIYSKWNHFLQIGWIASPVLPIVSVMNNKVGMIVKEMLKRKLL